MKKFVFMLFVLFLAVTFSMYADSEMKFGKELSLKESVKISALLDKPADHVDKAVRVEGTIVDVCANKGCWMSLAGDKEFQKLMVKVDDGDMVFPMTAKGKFAVVEGVLYEKKIPVDKVAEAKAHTCTEKGEKAHESCAKVAKAVYLLKPTAVVIKDN